MTTCFGSITPFRAAPAFKVEILLEISVESFCRGTRVEQFSHIYGTIIPLVARNHDHGTVTVEKHLLRDPLDSPFGIGGPLHTDVPYQSWNWSLTPNLVVNSGRKRGVDI